MDDLEWMTRCKRCAQLHFHRIIVVASLILVWRNVATLHTLGNFLLGTQFGSRFLFLRPRLSR